MQLPNAVFLYSLNLEKTSICKKEGDSIIDGESEECFPSVPFFSMTFLASSEWKKHIFVLTVSEQFTINSSKEILTSVIELPPWDWNCLCHSYLEKFQGVSQCKSMQACKTKPDSSRGKKNKHLALKSIILNWKQLTTLWRFFLFSCVAVLHLWIQLSNRNHFRPPSYKKTSLLQPCPQILTKWLSSS